MPKKIYLVFSIFIIIFIIIIAKPSSAISDLPIKLSGRILLQVEANGEAWYVNPANFRRYFLNRPNDAFEIMRNLGIGITNENLNKIPTGLVDYNDTDNDNDGLANRLEEAIGTDPNLYDTDNDGFSDRDELLNNHNPIGTGSLPIDQEYSKEQAGKIFLQVASQGEAWYINPTDNKKYYLGRPSDAFLIMKTFGLGINNWDLNKIYISYISDDPDPIKISVTKNAANAIRTGNKTEAVKYFIPAMKKSVEYTIDHSDANQKLALANILYSAKSYSETATKKYYKAPVYFSLGGYSTYLRIETEKQDDSTWLISSM